MWIKLLIGLAIGVTAGGLLGWTRSCQTGACPLTATPWRGAIWGGLMGLAFVWAFAGRSVPADVGPVTTGSPDVPALEDSDSFSEVVSGSSTPVVVKFEADWCGACKTYSPTFTQVADELGETASFYTVNVDRAGEIAKRYDIKYLPTTLVFRGGTVASRQVGALSAPDLKALIEGAS